MLYNLHHLKGAGRCGLRIILIDVKEEDPPSNLLLPSVAAVGERNASQARNV